MQVFLSLTRLERNTVALEFLTQISKAATILFLKHRMKSEDTQRTTEPSREVTEENLPSRPIPSDVEHVD